jgi:hypothetical protein
MHVVTRQEEVFRELAGTLHDPDLTTNQKLEAVQAMLQKHSENTLG